MYYISNTEYFQLVRDIASEIVKAAVSSGFPLIHGIKVEPLSAWAVSLAEHIVVKAQDAANERVPASDQSEIRLPDPAPNPNMGA